MSKPTDTAKPGITQQYLIERIAGLEAEKANLLQRAQDILASAQRANAELIAQANAVHGAAQQCTELLGMLAEASVPLAGSPMVSGGEPQPPVDKPAKVTATERARRKAEMRKLAAQRKPGKPTASLMGRITPEDDGGTAGAPAAGATAS